MAPGAALGQSAEHHGPTPTTAASSPCKPCSRRVYGQGALSHSVGGCDSVLCGSTNRQDLSSLPCTINTSGKSGRVPSTQLNTTDAGSAATCSSDSSSEKQPTPPRQHQEEERQKKEKQLPTCEFECPPFSLDFWRAFDLSSTSQRGTSSV